MMKGNSTFRWPVVFSLAAVLLTCALLTPGVEALLRAPIEKRADLITIDVLKQFGALERPPVVFVHGRHVEALKLQERDCSACHMSREGRMVPRFQRLEDAGRQEVMDTYHVQCQSCHRETRAIGAKSGPVTCGGCHVQRTDLVSIRQPMGLDLSLHARHSQAREKRCEACHHAYDKRQKKLIYLKGQEGTCRYCHGDRKVENRISMREASHLACIRCHQDTRAAKKDSGPIRCAGCHDPEARLGIARIENIARLERKQPDAVFVKTAPDLEPGQLPPESRMKLVPFDHKAHEGSNGSCRVCHHRELTSCVTCHSLGGEKKGGFVKLEQAMHQIGSDRSCTGCHRQRQQQPQCRGCHDFIPQQKNLPDAACTPCHRTPRELAGQGAQGAVRQLAARRKNPAMIPDSKIPETVVIGRLSRDFEPAEMPHRRMVRKLAAGLKDSRLADYFHAQPETLCQGCHHNSPAADKPPLCGSCHGQPFQTGNLFKPGLAGAYHQQCIGCHQKMGIEKPAANDCAGCHREKKKS